MLNTTNQSRHEKLLTRIHVKKNHANWTDKYLTLGKEQKQDIVKYRQNTLLAEAGILMLFAALGLIFNVGTAFNMILFVTSAVILIYTLPGVYKRYNKTHHIK